MGYSQFKGRKPFERASKIAHSEILNNPDVQEFVEGCALPSEPEGSQLETLQRPLPAADGKITSVIAIDGGMSEAAVRREFPSASITFMTFGPLMLELKDLSALDHQPFIGPEDMAQLKNLSRFSLSIPTKAIRPKSAFSFSEGVRRTIQDFLFGKKKELGLALQWLLFRGWLPEADRPSWQVPRCPATPDCPSGKIPFTFSDPVEMECLYCGKPVFLSDALRLYERIDDEQGAGGIMSYLLTSLEQLVVVHIIRSLLSIRPSTLREVLLIKDGPLAFFGTTAPLHAPMLELMAFLSDKGAGGPLLCLIGLEKSGAFVEHAMLIEPRLKPGHYLMFTNDYIYRYVLPGDPDNPQPYGHNTYYGSKLMYKSTRGDVFVATIPSIDPMIHDRLDNLQNAAEVLSTISELRCSMYDQALVPVVLANKLVSLADFPSSEILAKFVRGKLGSA